MFAVIKTGGKQYKVAQDDIVTVERLEGGAGDVVLLDEVLMLGGEDAAVEMGAPRVEGARVSAEVLDQTRGDKIVVFKKKRRQNYRRKKGHRQDLTRLRILEILTGGAEPSLKPARKVKTEKKAPDEKAKVAKAGTDESVAVAGSGPTLLQAPKGEADDLTKITGLGPKLAEKLNETGIYHFWQIAEWTPDQIDWLDERLKIKGRAEKDDWVAQAKELAKG